MGIAGIKLSKSLIGLVQSRVDFGQQIVEIVAALECLPAPALVGGPRVSGPSCATSLGASSPLPACPVPQGKLRLFKATAVK
jgi:hypothetical protein